MEHNEEQCHFEVSQIIEQKPFESSAVESFFTMWCKINDSIKPEIISRSEWEKKNNQGILKKRTDGKQTLFIPQDLQLWEMIGVVEAVDNDTFVTKPERKEEARKITYNRRKAGTISRDRTYSISGVN